MSVSEHLRRHVVGYLALFIALSGVSYAANKIKGNQIAKNAITSKHVKDGEIASADVADNALTGADIDEGSLNVLLADGSVTTQKLADVAVTIPKLAFDPATQAELDAVAAGSIPHGSIVDADIAAGAAIDDSKLGTINDAGKVADTALSSNVARLNDSFQAFTGTATFAEVQVNITKVGGSPGGPLTGFLTNNTTSGNQGLLNLFNQEGSGDTEHGILIQNADANNDLGTGILFSGDVTTAVDAGTSSIDTALDVGANDITTSTATISAAELSALDDSIKRAVPLPLTSFVNSTDAAALDFTTSNGTSPDLRLLTEGLVIEWDDDSDGAGGDIGDTDFVETTFTVPPDYVSGGAIRISNRQFGATGDVIERFFCEAGEGTGGFTDSDVGFTGVGGFFRTPVLDAFDYDANDSIHFRCRWDDGAGGTTADDPVRVHSVEFEYTSQR